MRTGIGSALCLALVALPQLAASQSKNMEGNGMQPQIVFVCEHGAALSVVSAAYFNKMAREQGLNMHAVARGATPQPDISVSARAGLKADGVPSELKHPQALSRKDAAHAVRIVTFYPLPAEYASMAPLETWNDVPATSVNYGLARDAIVRHLAELIKQLQANHKNR